VVADQVVQEHLAAQHRQWVRADPERSRRQVFSLDHQNLLFDSKVKGPRINADVFIAPPKIPATPRAALVDRYAIRQAIRYVQGIPSLTRHFKRESLAYLDLLENKLISHDGLSAAERSKLRLRINKLTAPERSVWEEWIEQTDPFGTRIGRTIDAWLAHKVDMSERHLFNPAWLEIPFAHQAAADYFARVPECLWRYFSLKRATPTPAFRGARLVSIGQSAEESDVLAEAIGSGLRFSKRPA
jgi:hypothetical protein